MESNIAYIQLSALEQMKKFIQSSRSFSQANHVGGFESLSSWSKMSSPRFPAECFLLQLQWRDCVLCEEHVFFLSCLIQSFFFFSLSFNIFRTHRPPAACSPTHPGRMVWTRCPHPERRAPLRPAPPPWLRPAAPPPPLVEKSPHRQLQTQIISSGSFTCAATHQLSVYSAHTALLFCLGLVSKLLCWEFNIPHTFTLLRSGSAPLVQCTLRHLFCHVLFWLYFLLPRLIFCFFFSNVPSTLLPEREVQHSRYEARDPYVSRVQHSRTKWAPTVQTRQAWR